jgi:hypothetical protein
MFVTVSFLIILNPLASCIQFGVEMVPTISCHLCPEVTWQTVVKWSNDNEFRELTVMA